MHTNGFITQAKTRKIKARDWTARTFPLRRGESSGYVLKPPKSDHLITHALVMGSPLTAPHTLASWLPPCSSLSDEKGVVSQQFIWSSVSHYVKLPKLKMGAVGKPKSKEARAQWTWSWRLEGMQSWEVSWNLVDTGISSGWADPE